MFIKAISKDEYYKRGLESDIVMVTGKCYILCDNGFILSYENDFNGEVFIVNNVWYYPVYDTDGNIYGLSDERLLLNNNTNIVVNDTIYFGELWDGNGDYDMGLELLKSGFIYITNDIKIEFEQVSTIYIYFSPYYCLIRIKGVYQHDRVYDFLKFGYNFSAYRAITNLGNCIFYCYANTAIDVKKMLIEHYFGDMIFETFDCSSILIQKESTINELINTNISYITMEIMYREECNE